MTGALTAFAVAVAALAAVGVATVAKFTAAQWRAWREVRGLRTYVEDLDRQLWELRQRAREDRRSAGGRVERLDVHIEGNPVDVATEVQRHRGRTR